MKRWGRWLKWVCGLLLLIAALLAWDGRALAMIRFAGNVHEPRLDSDFKQLEELLPKSDVVVAEMYVGLPHPYGEKDEFVRELWSQPNRSIKGYRFQRQPATPSEVVKTALVEVLSARESFRAYQGPKLCGVYHADFAVKLESGGVATWFLVCLGCGEVLIYSKDKELICELVREAELRLEDIWRDHQNIPFALVGTRLPIKQAILTVFGIGGHDASNSNRLLYAPAAALGKMYGRSQNLFWTMPGPDSVAINASARLWEETYESPQQAELRVKELFEQIRPTKGRKRTTVDEGFRFENRVYWIEGGSRANQEDLRRILERVRRYCEETRTHDVRFYD